MPCACGSVRFEDARPIPPQAAAQRGHRATPQPASRAQATHPDEGPVAARPLIPVLAVALPACSLAERDASLLPPDHGFLLTTLVAPKLAAVERALGTDPPRLVLLDPRWADGVGLEAIQRLHRLAPGIDWVICWPRPARSWLPLLLACGARGAVTCGSTPQARLKALNGVLDGEVWLPRQVLQWLYQQMLETAQLDSRTVQAAARLTPREAEVMALIHQGLRNQDVADHLGVSINTVKKHLASGFEKLGIQRRRQMLG